MNPVGTYNPACYLAAHGVYEHGDLMPPCDGRLIRAHLIPQGLIKREFPHGAWRYPDGSLDKVLMWQRDAMPPNAEGAGDAVWIKQDGLIWDHRAWVLGCGGPTGCGGHHGAFDQSRRLRLPLSAIPPATLELANELDLMWWVERTYGE